METTTGPNKNRNDERPTGFEAGRTGAAEGDMSFIGRKTEDAATYAGHKAEDAVSYLGHKAQDAASYVSHKTDDAGDKVGSGLRSLGHTVRDRAPEGIVGEASTVVANGLERSGRYLQEQGVKDIAEDVTSFVRRNPIPSLITGVAFGYLIGRVARS